MQNKLKWATEIIEAIEEYYNEDIISQAKIIKELYVSTKDDAFIKEFYDICYQYHICPYCLSPKIQKMHTEQRGDDYTYNEEIIEYICNKCGE